jgi:hypothetical protein
METRSLSVGGPRVFFGGQFVYRTLNGAMAVIAVLVTSAIMAAIALTIRRMGEDLLSDVVSAGFGMGALVIGGYGLWALWSWVRNRCIHVEVNEDGIVCGNRFRPWERVHAFEGVRYDNGVCLRFTPRRTGVWGGGMLPTTPLLTDEQYVELARDVSQGLTARFPHVVVAMHPLKATADS